MTRREGDDRGKQATGDHRVAVQNRSTVEQCCGVIPVIYEGVLTTKPKLKSDNKQLIDLWDFLGGKTRKCFVRSCTGGREVIST